MNEINFISTGRATATPVAIRVRLCDPWTRGARMKTHHYFRYPVIEETIKINIFPNEHQRHRHRQHHQHHITV